MNVYYAAEQCRCSVLMTRKGGRESPAVPGLQTTLLFLWFFCCCSVVASSRGSGGGCALQDQRVSLLLFYSIAEHNANTSSGSSASSCTSQTRTLSGTCTAWGENVTCAATDLTLSPVALPDYCCWQGVFCCTTVSCCSYGTQDTSCTSTQTSRSPYCNCEVGTVVELRHRDYAMTAALPDLLQPLYNMSCNLRSLELQSNQLSSSIPEAITALPSLRVLNLASNRECVQGRVRVGPGPGVISIVGFWGVGRYIKCALYGRWRTSLLFCACAVSMFLHKNMLLKTHVGSS